MQHLTRHVLPLAQHPYVRFTSKVILDALLAALAWSLIAQALGTDFAPWAVVFQAQWVVAAAVCALLFQVQRQHYRFTGRSDFLRIGLATALASAVTCLLASLEFWHRKPVPIDFFIFTGAATGLLWVLLRASIAEIHDFRRSIHVAQDRPPAPQTRCLVVGAGHAGHLILQEVLRHPELGYRVVGFVDDAPEKQKIKINGTPILGPGSDLPRLVRRHAIDLAILAIPSASGATLRRLTQTLSGLGVAVKTVPALFNLLGEQSWVPEIKDVAIEDLLRRDPVSLDQGSLREVIQDAVVLITGGGGSIGAELARQAAAFRPARIVLLGRGENSLWEAERQLRQTFPNQAISLELCDIRNPVRLAQAFSAWRPEIVLHAAAHKHVPFLEKHPDEAVNNNILGTFNVLREAQACGARTFVNISTDKAVNPTNVLGASKYIAECLVQEAAAHAGPAQRFVSVRFGNVLGSRGSVIPLFREQIRRGGPITVTHPDVARYFMTIPEASQLVLQAGVLGGNGRIYVLDMGEPVRIAELAADMARLSGLTVGEDIELRFTGLRPGEKLFEEIFLEDEDIHSPVHPKVFEGTRAPMDGEHLLNGVAALSRALGLPAGQRQAAILAGLKALVPTYRPSAMGLGRYERLGAEAQRTSLGSR